MATKKVFKVYKILNDSIGLDSEDIKELVVELIGRVNQWIIDKWWSTRFSLARNSSEYSKNFSENSAKVYLYTATHNIDNILWNFFDPAIIWSETFNKSEDIFVCFVLINNNIYIFTSSHAFTYFIPFIDEDFALTVASKLVTWKVKYEKSISITWETLTSDLIYRGLKGFSKFENLWKVVKGFVWEVDRNKSNKIMDLVIPSNKKYFCEIWNSFSLRMSLSFDDLLRLISDLDILYLEGEQEDDYQDFQMLEKINPRFHTNKPLIKELKENISKTIYEYYKNDSGSYIDFFEMVHPTEFVKFIETTSYEIQFEWHNTTEEWILNLKKIIDHIRDVNPSLSLDNFSKGLEEWITFYWMDGESNPTWIESVKKSILRYIVCEFTFNGNVYFVVNGDFYIVKNDFIDVLNSDLCDELVEHNIYLDSSVESKLKEWNQWLQDTEHKYNKEYLWVSDFIVLDKVFYKNIEFCDIHYSQWNDSYLFHVKKWFDWDMRVLSEQVLMSSLMLSEYRKLWNVDVIRGYYASLKNKKKFEPDWVTPKSMFDIWAQTDTLSETQFLDLFSADRNMNFVLAFTYSNDLITTFRSRDRDLILSALEGLSIIWKYELLSLIKNMRWIWVDFYITQIKTI